MNEYPIFVPFGQEHLAAIVTVPEEQPTSVVLFLQGLGAPRSHRYGLWKKTAHGLAERGLASVRLDYPQLGDSSGVFRAEMETPPVEEARAALDTARDALGVERFGVIGNCMGLLAGFELAATEPACASVGCFLTDPPRGIIVDRSTPSYQLAARRMSRKVPSLRRFASQFVHVRKGSFRHGLTPEVARTMRSCSMLFLLVGSPETGRRLGEHVNRLREQIGVGTDRRVDVQTVVADGTELLQIPLQAHPQVVDAFVTWMSETLSAPAGEDPRIDSAEGLPA